MKRKVRMDHLKRKVQARVWKRIGVKAEIGVRRKKRAVPRTKIAVLVVVTVVVAAGVAKRTSQAGPPLKGAASREGRPRASAAAPVAALPAVRAVAQATVTPAAATVAVAVTATVAMTVTVVMAVIDAESGGGAK